MNGKLVNIVLALAVDYTSSCLAHIVDDEEYRSLSFISLPNLILVTFTGNNN